MKVLHICNDFSGSPVHARLIQALDNKGLSQIVYSPVRSLALMHRNTFQSKDTKFVYLNNIKPYHRYLYHVKANGLYQDLKKSITINSIQLCHAGTLFSDGILAYKLYKEFGIPYVVAVRSVDVDKFLRYMPHTWIDGRKVLLNARHIVFISPSLKEKLVSSEVIKPILGKIEKKFVLQPNGIDDYWLNNICSDSTINPDKLIYVGTFITRKHVPLLQQAVLNLKTEFPDIHLTLVGGKGEDQETVLRLTQVHPTVFDYLGQIKDKDKLAAIYKENSVFAMASRGETFGLVYIEALSQGLAVLYTKGEGVDGLLDDNNGIGIRECTLSEVTKKLAQLIHDRKGFTNKTIDFSQYDWNNIADNYLRLYENSL